MTRADLARSVRAGFAAGLPADGDSSPRDDVVFDRAGVATYLGPAALEFGATWGARDFWDAVGRTVVGEEFAGRKRGAPFYLSVDEYRSDGSAELVALIEGRHRPDGGVSLTLHLPERGQETSAATEPVDDGRRQTRRGGIGVQLKELVHSLTDLIWTLERDKPQSAEGPILSYVQEAVAVEIEYRRRMRDLDRRLADIEGVQGVSVSS